MGLRLHSSQPTRLRILAAHSRPRLCLSPCPSWRRGCGKGRAPAGTRDPCAGNAHGVTAGEPEAARPFPQQWFSAYTRSAWRDDALLPPSPCGLLAHRRPGWADAPPQGLTPAFGRQHHAISPTADAPAGLSKACVRSPSKPRQGRSSAPFVPRRMIAHGPHLSGKITALQLRSRNAAASTASQTRISRRSRYAPFFG